MWIGTFPRAEGFFSNGSGSAQQGFMLIAYSLNVRHDIRRERDSSLSPHYPNRRRISCSLDDSPSVCLANTDPFVGVP